MTPKPEADRPAVAHFRSVYLGRSETFIYRQLTHLRAVRAVVFARQLTCVEEFPFDAIEVYPPARHSAWGYMDRAGRRLFNRELYVASRLRQWRARLLHAHFGSDGWEALPIRRETRLPLVTTFYGYDMSLLPRDPLWRTRYAELFAGGDLFLVEGPHMRAALETLGCPDHKVRIQRIGIDVARIPYRPRQPLRGRSWRLLFCGRLTEKKGLMDALEALAALRLHHPAVILRVIGDGEDREAVTLRVAALGLQECVQLLGSQPYAVVAEELAAADVLVAPSRTAANGDSEGGAPTILLEAQAAGLPVVTTTHADIPFVVGDGAALLASERDPAALTRCLIRLLEVPEQWSRMGEAGRRHVEKFHDIRIIVRQLECTYFDLMGSGL
jgi:colanic acid/amylovoran biosynthesis glycosyltransferase